MYYFIGNLSFSIKILNKILKHILSLDPNIICETRSIFQQESNFKVCLWSKSLSLPYVLSHSNKKTLKIEKEEEEKRKKQEEEDLAALGESSGNPQLRSKI